MKRNKKNIFVCIYFVLLIILLCGCNEKKKDEDIKPKISSEIKYLDNELVDIFNGLNGIDFSRNKVIIEDGVDKSLTSQSDSGEKSESNKDSSSGEASKGSEQEKRFI